MILWRVGRAAYYTVLEWRQPKGSGVQILYSPPKFMDELTTKLLGAWCIFGLLTVIFWLVTLSNHIFAVVGTEFWLAVCSTTISVLCFVGALISGNRKASSN